MTAGMEVEDAMDKANKAQIAVLMRLAAGARIQQRIDGCFIYAGTTEVVRANTVYALENRGLIRAGIITDTGRALVEAAKEGA